MIHDTEFVLRRVITFEHVLKNRLGADGKGLGSMAREVRFQMPRSLADRLFYLASQRNVVVHDGTGINIEEFGRIAEEAREILNSFLTSSKYLQQRNKISAWIAQCPVEIDDRARNRVVSALRQSLDGEDPRQNGHPTSFRDSNRERNQR